MPGTGNLLIQTLIQSGPYMLLHLLTATVVLVLLLRHRHGLGRARMPANVGVGLLFANALLEPVTAFARNLLFSRAVDAGSYEMIAPVVMVIGLFHALLMAAAIILLGVAITRRETA